jgi:hypothetical protein
VARSKIENAFPRLRTDGKPFEITTVAERQARALRTDTEALSIIQIAAEQIRQKTDHLRALRLRRELIDGPARNARTIGLTTR